MAKKKKVWTKEAFAKNELRKSFKRWFAYYEAKKLARVERGKYKCSSCQQLFKEKEIELDHKSPVVPVTKAGREQSMDEYVDRLFVNTENLDPLCKNCHKSKSAVENEQRKLNRSKRKLK